MCLAVPGKVLSIDEESGFLRTGRVSFNGVVTEISLAFVPDAAIGDYVIVHVGFALSKLDEAEAMEVFATLKELDEAAREERALR